MKYRILLIVCIYSFFSFTCDDKKKQIESITESTDKEEIIKIGYSLFGGWIGKGYNLEITPDSIHYFYEIMNYNTDYVTRDTGNYDVLIPPELWADLMEKLDLELFGEIESRASRQEVDASDREYFVETNKRRISFLNGEDDEEFVKLKEFFDTILKLEHECREKAEKTR